MLTNAQKITLKNHIVTNGHSGKTATEIQDIYNADATPAVMGWRESVPATDIWEATDLTVLIGRSTGERDVYGLMVGGSLPNDATRTKIRKAIVDIFSGSGGSTVRADILTAMTEKCSLAETVIGGSNATTDAVTALKRNWIGDLTYNDVLEVLSM